MSLFGCLLGRRLAHQEQSARKLGVLKVRCSGSLRNCRRSWPLGSSPLLPEVELVGSRPLAPILSDTVVGSRLVIIPVPWYTEKSRKSTRRRKMCPGRAAPVDGFKAYEACCPSVRLVGVVLNGSARSFGHFVRPVILKALIWTASACAGHSPLRSLRFCQSAA
jgi:hypothetical protein